VHGAVNRCKCNISDYFIAKSYVSRGYVHVMLAHN